MAIRGILFFNNFASFEPLRTDPLHDVQTVKLRENKLIDRKELVSLFRTFSL